MAIKLNNKGLQHAKSLINTGKYDVKTPWEGGPGAETENQYLEKNGIDKFSQWYIGKDTEANTETKGAWKFPFSKDFQKVYYKGVIAAKQRAAQQGYNDIMNAADTLLNMIKAKVEKETMQVWEGFEFKADSKEYLLLPAGTFHSLRYGKISVSEKHLQEMAEYVKTHGEIVVDYNHQSLADDPEKAKAAGWIVDAQVREITESDISGEVGKKFVGKPGLFIKIKWTEEAQKLIKEGQYKYLSPTFNTQSLDILTGKEGGAVLVATALTNRPFLQGINGRVELIADEVDTGSQNHYNKDDMDNKNTGGEDMAKIKELFGVETPEEAYKILSDTQKERDKLKEEVKEFMQKLDETEKQLAEYKKKELEWKIDNLVTEGKVLPAEKELAIEMAQKDEKLFEKWLETKKKIDLGVYAGQGENKEYTKDDVVRMVQKFYDEHQKEYADEYEAMMAFFEKNPEFKKIYYNF